MRPPSADLPCPDHPHETRFELLAEFVEARLGAPRLHMDNEIRRRQFRPMPPSSVDLSNATLRSVSNHCVADLPASCDPQPRHSNSIRRDEEGNRSTAKAATASITSDEILPATKLLVHRKRFLPRRHVRFPADQTVRRLRPLRRRRLITARPCRVRIRARNPCFFARLRLFG